MNKKLFYALMAFTAMTALYSCDDDDLAKAYDETEIESTGQNSGITNVLSWIKAWPNLEIRVAYKIF